MLDVRVRRYRKIYHFAKIDEALYLILVIIFNLFEKKNPLEHCEDPTYFRCKFLLNFLTQNNSIQDLPGRTNHTKNLYEVKVYKTSTHSP